MTLLAAYNFDEASGAVVDVTGNGHGFSLAGVTSRTASAAGHTDKGLTQTAAENAVTLAPFGQTASRTLSAWVKITASVADGRFFEQAGAGESTWELLIRVDTIHLQAWNATTFGRASMPRPTDNLWHHWAGTYDGTNLQIYLDGVLQATTAFAGPLRTNATVINVFNNIGPAIVIDDVRMYDTALSAAAITTDMSTPVGTAGTAFSGSVALSGSGQLAGVGKPAIPGALGLSGAGSASDIGTPGLTGTLAASGAGTISAAGQPALPGSLPLTGGGALALAGAPSVPGSMSLVGAGALGLQAAPGLQGALLLAGAGQLAGAPAGGPVIPGRLTAGASQSLTATDRYSVLTATTEPTSRLEASDGV